MGDAKCYQCPLRKLSLGTRVYSLLRWWPATATGTGEEWLAGAPKCALFRPPQLLTTE